MIEVHCIMQDMSRGLFALQGIPAIFETEEEAWEIIQFTMNSQEIQNRPRMMWLRKDSEHDRSIDRQPGV